MDVLKLQTATYLLRARYDEIVCIIAEGNYSDILLRNGYKKTVTVKLKGMYEILSQSKHHPFIRVGKSLIVNREYVFYVEPGTQSLILSGQGVQPLPLSASREALKELKDNLGKEK